MSIFVSDNFNRAAGTLAGTTPSTAGAAWAVSGALRITPSGQVRGNGGGVNSGYSSGPAGTDYYSSATLSVNNTSDGATPSVCVSITGGDFYYLNYFFSSLTLKRFKAGSATGLGVAFTLGAGTYTIALSRLANASGVQLVATCLRSSDGFYLNSSGTFQSAFANCIDLVDPTASAITTVGVPGIQIYSTQADSGANYLDNYVAADGQYGSSPPPPPPAVVAINDTNFNRSPYNWYTSGTTYIQTCNPGSYLKLSFTGTSIGLNVDVSPLTGGGVSAGSYPSIEYSIDGGVWTRYQLVSTDTAISLATGLSAGTHTAEIHVVSTEPSLDRWTTPIEALRITGVTLDNAQTLVPPTLKPIRVLIFGDSNGEGVECLANGQTPSHQDAHQAYGPLFGEGFNAEYGVVAYGSQGFDQAGTGNVPALSSAWSYYFSGQSRLTAGLLTPAPDYILCCHGENGGASPTTVTSLIAAWRAAAPNAYLIFCSPANLNGESNIQSGVNTANDPKAVYVTTSQNFLAGLAYANSAYHMSARGHAHYSAALIKLIQQASTIITKSTSRQVTRSR